VLQTKFHSGSGFPPLGSGLKSDSKKLDSEHLCCLQTCCTSEGQFCSHHLLWLS